MKLKKNLALAAAFIFFANPSMSLAQDAPPLPAVSVAVIEKQPAYEAQSFLGRIEAVNSAYVSIRTEGFIQKIHFKEGQMVKAGDPLFDLDPAVHLSALAQAEAVVAGAEAAVNLAEVTYQRFAALARNSATSRAEADRALAEMQMAQASLLQAQAQLEARKLDFSFTKITSPISGRVGRTAFNVGSLVNPASGPLVNVIQLDPIRVVISVRERDFISANPDGVPSDFMSQNIAPKLRLANGDIYPLRGALDFMDNQINPKTGTIDVRVLFENPQNILLPGGTVEATLSAIDPPLVPVVPIAATQQDLNGLFVLLLDENNMVEVRPIKVGPQVDQYFVVTSGLKDGDRVVVEGLQKIGPGMKVNPLPLSPLKD